MFTAGWATVPLALGCIRDGLGALWASEEHTSSHSAWHTTDADMRQRRMHYSQDAGETPVELHVEVVSLPLQALGRCLKPSFWASRIHCFLLGLGRHRLQISWLFSFLLLRSLSGKVYVKILEHVQTSAHYGASSFRCVVSLRESSSVMPARR